MGKFNPEQWLGLNWQKDDLTLARDLGVSMTMVSMVRQALGQGLQSRSLQWRLVNWDEPDAVIAAKLRVHAGRVKSVRSYRERLLAYAYTVLAGKDLAFTPGAAYPGATITGTAYPLGPLAHAANGLFYSATVRYAH